jgi:hypothetical protein
MKRKLLLLLFIISPLFLLSQQIDKELVVIEIKTGTWCQFCPGAAMGADELVENFSDAVAIVKHHGGDDYEIGASSTRIAYYGSSGYPTAYFNGLNAYVGGSNTQSMYSNYLPIYNNAIDVMTSFDLTLDVVALSDYTYSVTVTAEKVDAYVGTNLVAHLALTESHIDDSWQGMDEVNFVNRGMYPNGNGTALDFSSEDVQILNFTVNLDQAYVIENCELVAFIQDNDTKEILQGTKFSLNTPIGTNNAMLLSIDHPNGNYTICEDLISPIITVKNRGSENLTSLTVLYDINGEGIQTYTWTGDIAFGETEEVTLDPISYTPIESNSLGINLTMPNNENDDDEQNNLGDVIFEKSVETTTTTYLEIDPNGSFGLPWELQDSEATVLYSGTASGSSLINETFELSIDNCYYFIIESSVGNGIPGDGYFQLSDSEENVVFYGAGDSFSNMYTLPFKAATATSNVDITESENIKVYPNPANNLLTLIIPDIDVKSLIISDISGKQIFSLFNNLNGVIQINTEEFENGIYFVNIKTMEDTFSKKIIVIH